MSPNTTRILLIDDNPDDRLLVRREAEALFPSAEIREVGTREEFEAAAGLDGYELIVTDLHLRWGNGREVISAFRRAHPQCAIVMFTGTGDEMTAVELMKSGLDDYVVKHARQLPRLRASMKLAVENARHRSKLSEREQQLTAALAHKDIVVRELHHRVKNHLQTIIALLTLRAKDKRGEVAEDLNDLAGRMKALGHVQARIYESRTLDHVDFSETLADIARELVSVYGQKRIRLVLTMSEPAHLEVGRAMPLALLCYEIVLNSMKHAWADGREGKLVVQVEKRYGGLEVIVADDGIGFEPSSIRRGFGSRLTSALAHEANVQLSVSSSPGAGTRISVRLP